MPANREIFGRVSECYLFSGVMCVKHLALMLLSEYFSAAGHFFVALLFSPAE